MRAVIVIRERPEPKRTVCLDFDGVIHSYTSPFAAPDVIPDPPTLGASEAVRALREKYRVVVHSTRCATAAGRRAIKAWLKRYAIEVDEIAEHKPPADVYLDDKALRFRGDWSRAINEIEYGPFDEPQAPENTIAAG